MLRRPRTITLSQKAPKSLKPQQARKLIRRFHILQKNRTTVLSRLAKSLLVLEDNYKQVLGRSYTEEVSKFKLPKNPELFKIDDTLSQHQLTKIIARIDAEMAQRGGLHAYQMASTVGQNSKRGGDSLKKLVSWFQELGRTAESALEIGCLSPHNDILTSGMFGRITRIDLNSQSPQILQQDFMERPLPTDDSQKFDVISCSLVLNFVPSPRERGRMLRRMTEFLKEPREGNSSFFLVLPLPCVSNSRYFDKDLLLQNMTSLGFLEVRYYEAKKVAYWLFDWKGRAAMTPAKQAKKKELYSGPSRNNFYVELEYPENPGNKVSGCDAG